MEFKLYADELMTTEFGAAFVHDGAESRLSQVSFVRPFEVKRGVMYFGCPQANVKLVNRAQPESDDVVLSVVDALAWRVNGADVVSGSLLGVGLHVYRVVQGGRLADVEPPYATDAGAMVADGSAQLLCLGARHLLGAIRLALSEDDVSSGGQSLIVGKAIVGGAAVAIHYEIQNDVAEFYDALNEPMLSLELNDCVVVPSGAFGD